MSTSTSLDIEIKSGRRFLMGNVAPSRSSGDTPSPKHNEIFQGTRMKHGWIAL